MIGVTVVLGMAVLALAIIAVNQDRRIMALLTDHANERVLMEASAREERADLLQRIQAPEQAVVTHAAGGTPEPVLPVAWDDDEDAAEAIEARFGV